MNSQVVNFWPLHPEQTQQRLGATPPLSLPTDTQTHTQRMSERDRQGDRQTDRETDKQTSRLADPPIP